MYYVVVACFPWQELATESTCLEDLLVKNHWASSEDLVNATRDDHKSMVLLKLSEKLNKTIHTLVDLSVR